MRRWVALGALAVALAWWLYLQTYLTGPPGALEDFSPAPVEAAALAPRARVSSTLERSSTASMPNAPAAQEPSTLVQPQPESVPAPPPSAASDRVAAFRSAFESEPRDAFWANDQEPSLLQLLAAVEFGAEDVSEVACRRTVCRVTFKEPVVGEGRVVALQARVLANFADAQLVPKDPQSERADYLYLLRAEYALEAPRSK